jgi:hypothetical protein
MAPKTIQPHVAQVAPQNVAAQIIVTAFTDGRPIDVRANCDPLNGLLLLAAAITNAVKVAQQQQVPQGQADPVDKKWEFLGPRP